MKRLRHVIPFDVLVMLYNTLILPHINYCILAWGYQSDKILLLQKKCLRVITGSKFFAHSDPLFKAIGFLKVEDLFVINKIKLYFIYIKGMLPAYFQDLVLQENIHCYGTRKWRVSHDFAKNCVQYSIAPTINNCPSDIKCKLYTHSLSGLIWYCKRYFIDSYVIECNIPRCCVFKYLIYQVYVYGYIWLYVCIGKCMCMYLYVCMCIHIYVCIYVCMCAGNCICMCMHINKVIYYIMKKCFIVMVISFSNKCIC